MFSNSTTYDAYETKESVKDMMDFLTYKAHTAPDGLFEVCYYTIYRSSPSEVFF